MPPLSYGGRGTLAGERGGGESQSDEGTYILVLYIYKYFVVSSILSQEEKKEADDELEKITDRLVATLKFACSKKKKKKR